MSGTGPACRHLPWDSDFFERRIARVESARGDPTLMPRALAWCVRERVDCAYFLVDVADLPSVRQAEAHGFRLVDVRLTLGRRGGVLPEDSGEGTRASRPDDLDALRRIASVSHRDTRFYQDGGFPEARCAALYETWITRSCEGYADAVLVADVDGTVGGYLTCHRDSDGVGRIGLTAVAPEARGRGVGRRLVASGLRWFRGHGVEAVRVVTQGRNVRAQQLYQGAGFVTWSMELWYHRWFSRETSGGEA